MRTTKTLRLAWMVLAIAFLAVPLFAQDPPPADAATAQPDESQVSDAPVGTLIAEPVGGDLAERGDRLEPRVARVLGHDQPARDLEVAALKQRQRGAFIAASGLQRGLRDPVPCARIDVHRHGVHPTGPV